MADIVINPYSHFDTSILVFTFRPRGELKVYDISRCLPVIQLKEEPIIKRRSKGYLMIPPVDESQHNGIISIVNRSKGKEEIRRGNILETDRPFSVSSDMRVYGVFGNSLRLKINSKSVHVTGSKSEEDIYGVASFLDKVGYIEQIIKDITYEDETFKWFIENCKEGENGVKETIDIPEDLEFAMDFQMLEYLYSISTEYDDYGSLMEFFDYLVGVEELCKDFELDEISIGMECRWVFFGRKINRRKLSKIIREVPGFECTYDPELSTSCKIYYVCGKRMKCKKMIDTSVTFTIKTTGKICVSGPGEEINEEIYNIFCGVIEQYKSEIFY